MKLWDKFLRKEDPENGIPPIDRTSELEFRYPRSRFRSFIPGGGAASRAEEPPPPTQVDGMSVREFMRGLPESPSKISAQGKFVGHVRVALSRLIGQFIAENGEDVLKLEDAAASPEVTRELEALARIASSKVAQTPPDAPPPIIDVEKDVPHIRNIIVILLNTVHKNYSSHYDAVLREGVYDATKEMHENRQTTVSSGRGL